MRARWGDASAFRADPAAVPTAGPSRRQSIALLLALVLVAGVISSASFLIRPDKARSFQLVSGSVFINDALAPVGIDLATGKPTVRLVNANKQVGAKENDQLSLTPLSGGTLLFNNGHGAHNANSGQFNMVDSTGFLLKSDGGVPLPPRTDAPITYGFADTDTAVPSAYLERTGPAGTGVFLVSNSTVTSAIGAVGTVKPRASVSVAAVGDGTGASANGDLWLFLGAGARRQAVRFSVPSGDTNGARLSTAPGIPVTAHAALGVGAAVGSAKGQVVGIAEPQQIRLIAAKGKPVTKPYRAPGVVSVILPASNAGDRLAYLIRGANGWNLMSVRTDGTDLRGPKRLAGLPDDDLAPPAFSENALYTADLSTGMVYRIDVGNGAVSKVSKYPALPQEAGTSLGDITVIGTGPRVIVNSPQHRQALALFTDGVRGPLVISKSNAVSILADSNADTFTQTKGGLTNQQPKNSSAIAKPNQPVSTRVDCKTVNQKPHVPTITQGIPGSRSVALSWTYPVIDQQDCVPSSYLVSLKVLSNGAPQPRSTYKVQGQQSISIDGLYPLTRYSLTVAAYLNNRGTTSAPFTVTTGPEGPAAPTGLQVSPDSSGNWKLSWNSCGTVAAGCVPATSWQVTPSFCDGVGLSNPPAPINLPADPTTKAQPPTVFGGTDALLGRGLSFQVTGTGTRGGAGTPSARSDCVYSWQPPTVSAMTLRASTPDVTSVGGSSTTNVTLNLGSHPARDVGGYGAQIVLTLTGDGVTQTRSFVFNGNQSMISTDFGNVHPGANYTAAATVQPAHGGSAVSVPPVQVAARANWPALSLSASCTPSGLTTCTLAVKIHGVSRAVTGELFNFDGTLRCVNANAAVEKKGFDPATDEITVTGLDQTADFYSTCTVYGNLSEAGSPPLVFGGSPSPKLSDTFDMGDPVTLGASAGDFRAAWDGDSADVLITYQGSESARLGLTTNWAETVSPPGGSSCVTGTGQLTDGTATVTVPTDCVQSSDGATGWQVSVSYDDQIGGGHHGPFPVSLSGPAPTYQQPTVCSPGSSITAAWGTNVGDPIQVGYSGTAASLAGCGPTWTYQVLDASGAPVCGDPQSLSAPLPTVVGVSIANCTATPVNGWKVRITWQDPNNPTPTTDVTVPGDPPS